LKLRYQGHSVGELEMHFLHDGRPDVFRPAEVPPPAANLPPLKFHDKPQETLAKILACYSVCSKEWIIRQYDHEVQGGSVIKPLVGVVNDGPSDAAVVMPVLGSQKGLAIGCGINPRYADFDSYAAAACAIDEALRNVVAVGANPSKTAILDNFCWGNCNDPLILGSLVRAADACKDVALAFGTPFVSGKDSLNNEYRSADRRISIPGTLLITAMGQVSDVTRCVTMDFKQPGNAIYVVGTTRNEMGGSHYALVTGQTGGEVPRVDLSAAPKLFATLHTAISKGLVRSCHDCSEGGLAVALAEMAFAGGIGADVVHLSGVAPSLPDTVKLFSESPSRFVLEVEPGHEKELAELFAGQALMKLGSTVKEDRLRIAGENGEWLIWAKLSELKDAWQKPLKW
jgi:phosphoribosylformylglycinamidine synthase